MSRIEFVFADIHVDVHGNDVRCVTFRRGRDKRQYRPAICSWLRLWRVLLPRVIRMNIVWTQSGPNVRMKL